jgi:glycosyltransferase involved in cell wall biosynthesis
MRANRVCVIPPPFPSDLPTGSEELPGAPPLLLLGGGWPPNRDSISWFFDSIWDDVRRENPKAHAHVFGCDAKPRTPATSWHPSPSDSRHIFWSGAILVVPLRIASGIRMKIIESWARGIPVVATPEAVRGLEARDGRELLLARDGHEFGAAIRRINEERGLRKQLTEAGRIMVATRHDPARIVSLLEETYRAAQR